MVTFWDKSLYHNQHGHNYQHHLPLLIANVMAQLSVTGWKVYNPLSAVNSDNTNPSVKHHNGSIKCTSLLPNTVANQSGHTASSTPTSATNQLQNGVSVSIVKFYLLFIFQLLSGKLRLESDSVSERISVLVVVIYLTLFLFCWMYNL